MVSASPRRPPRPRNLSPSALAIHNVVVAGRRTSVRLEASMWSALQEIVTRRGVGLNDLVTEIDRDREALSLTAAIRVYIVNFFRAAAGGEAAAAPRPFRQ